jgi:hypothetical protein
MCVCVREKLSMNVKQQYFCTTLLLSMKNYLLSIPPHSSLGHVTKLIGEAMLIYSLGSMEHIESLSRFRRI